MQSWISRLSYINNYEKIEYGFEGNLVYQNHSDFYKEITEVRYSLGFSFKYQWWQMNLGYVSKYLQYDDYGQFFIDPLIINFSF